MAQVESPIESNCEARSSGAAPVSGETRAAKEPSSACTDCRCRRCFHARSTAPTRASATAENAASRGQMKRQCRAQLATAAGNESVSTHRSSSAESAKSRRCSGSACSHEEQPSRNFCCRRAGSGSATSATTRDREGRRSRSSSLRVERVPFSSKATVTDRRGSGAASPVKMFGRVEAANPAPNSPAPVSAPVSTCRRVGRLRGPRRRAGTGVMRLSRFLPDVGLAMSVCSSR